ncbi:MAG: class I SAM-dependent methyltransferase [Burkholderiales bacterium]|nr:class I SAM-dependent methyltransferase [Burkholderiales bacterium]
MARLIRPLARIVLAFLLLTAASAWATGADPAINAPFRDPDFREWVERFEREGREVYDRRHAIVEATGVKPGMAVADVGAGTGLFTLLFARRVNPGSVYAVDISRPFVEAILRRAREAGLGNIRGVVNTQEDSGLAPASIDLAFVCDTYHHFEAPQAMLASLHRALRPGGSLVIVDFQRIPGTSSRWVLDHVRAGKETVIAEVTAAGFRLVEDRPLLRDNYFLRFVREP